MNTTKAELKKEISEMNEDVNLLLSKIQNRTYSLSFLIARYEHEIEQLKIENKKLSEKFDELNRETNLKLVTAEGETIDLIERYNALKYSHQQVVDRCNDLELLLALK